MRRKLNNRNKMFIGIFSIIVLAIIGILVVSVNLSSKNGSTVYTVSSNSVVFDSESNLIDTSLGGEVMKRWNDAYYYVSSEDDSYDIGDTPVIYEKTKNEVQIFGDTYQIYSDGSIIENTNLTTSNFSKTNFYKLSDRVYLVVSKEIYNADKSIYASNYLIVYIDKKGNASLLNDSINVKTINPMILIFDEYAFDIANEKLIIGDKSIDLKSINGSTNEYVEKTPEEEINVDLGDFVDKYNSLVNSFQQYVDNTTLLIGSSQQISTSNNFIVTDSSSSSSSSSSGSSNSNLTNITKSISLRGALSYPTYIDVTYIVSDIADKYDAVYLLVTGYMDGQQTTEKILLDKYATTYRINDLEPKHEYSISLGYMITGTAVTGETTITDNIEDVINVRTTNNDMSLTIEKISKGYVYFNFKMSKNYAIESGKISLYTDERYQGAVSIDTTAAMSSNGYSGKIQLVDGTVMELRLEDAVYASKTVDLNVKRKFVY